MSAILAGIQKGIETSRDLLVPACREVIGPAAGLKIASGVVFEHKEDSVEKLDTFRKTAKHNKADTCLNLNFR